MRARTVLAVALLAAVASACATSTSHDAGHEAAARARLLSVVFANFPDTRAKLYVDGRTVFDGELNAADPSTGISLAVNVALPTGPARFRLVSEARTVDATLNIAPETKFVVINPHTAPYIDAAPVLLLD